MLVQAIVPPVYCYHNIQDIVYILIAFLIFQNTSLENSTLENSESSQNEQIPIQQIKKKSSNKRQSQDDDNILKEAIEIMKKPKDDFDRFGEYVALELKTLKSDYYRGLLKSEIRKSIANISDMDERNHWSRVMPSPSSINTSSCSTPMPSPTVVQSNFSSPPSGESQSTQDFYNAFNVFM